MRAGRPSGLREDSALLDQATLESPDSGVVFEHMTALASSVGVDIRTGDVLVGELGAELLQSLEESARASLGPLAGANGEVLHDVTVVVEVRGGPSSVATYLELVERSEVALSLGDVRLVLVPEGLSATFGVSGLRFAAPSVSARVALAQAALLADGRP